METNTEINELAAKPTCPAGADPAEWDSNLSEPALYGGISADRSREETALGPDCEAMFRFREILVQSQEEEWLDKTLAGLSHKPLWRDEQSGASISLVRFTKGAGIPQRHSHASNQFMFCLQGRYIYLATGITLTAGSFYWNPKGCLHGPTVAEEDSVLLEFYDGPHYPTRPPWYSSDGDTI